MAKDGLERWKPAKSSAINRVVYNKTLQRLAVEFKGGRRYTYDKVSAKKFAALKRSSSAGRWINARLKPTSGQVRKVMANKGALRSVMTSKRGVGGRTISQGRGGSSSGGGRTDG